MAKYSTNKGQLLVIWITGMTSYYIAEVISENPLKFKVMENGPFAHLKDGDFIIKEAESAEIQDEVKSIVVLRRFVNVGKPLISGLKRFGVTDGKLYDILNFCGECGDTGAIKTGNNCLPCSCPAGDRAFFNQAGVIGEITGAEMKRHFLKDSPEPILIGEEDIDARGLPGRKK
jgi:hypothetical protein